MVMSSHEIGSVAMQQQAMFGNYHNYAQQITPPYAGGESGQGNPITGYNPGPPQNQSPYRPYAGGFMQGTAPPPPPIPMPQPGWGMPQYGGTMSMMAALPMAPRGSYVGQAVGEQLAGSALGGLSAMANIGSTVSGVAGLGAAGLGVLCQ
jgi:hypothetical protein